MSKKALALFYGCICHLSFAFGVGLMMYSIYFGLPSLFIELPTRPSMLWNALLVIHFPFLHSYLLSAPGRKWLGLLAPRSIRKELGTTLFATAASLQLILVFGLWSGTSAVLWQPHSWSIWLIFSLAYGASWLLLLKAMSDASLALQTGALGWWAVYKGGKPKYPRFSTSGLNRWTRNPIYVSFALILWTAPVWTSDRIIVTLVWTIYCIVGPYFKERRYSKAYGEAYMEYKKVVPYWIPHVPHQSSRKADS